MSLDAESCMSKWEQLQKYASEALARCEKDYPNNNAKTERARILVEQFCQKDAPKNAVDVANLQTCLDTIMSQCRRPDPF